MAPKTDQRGQIVTQQQRAIAPSDKRMTLEAALLGSDLKEQIRRAVPKHVDPDRLARIALTALRTTKHLSKCGMPSFMGCLMQCAQLGLEPNTPLQHAFLIPRRNKKGEYDCTLMLGYQGMIDLALRSGKIESLMAHVVREGDEYVFELGLHANLIHRPSTDHDRDSRNIIAAYAVAHLKGSSHPTFEALSAPQIAARRARSATPNDGPWVTDPEAMARKTAVRALFKWLPKSVELAAAEEIEVRGETGRQTFVPEIAHALSDSMRLQFPADLEEEEIAPVEVVQAAPVAIESRKREPKPAQQALVAAHADEGDPEPPAHVTTAGADHPMFDPQTGEVFEPGANDEP